MNSVSELAWYWFLLAGVVVVALTIAAVLFLNVKKAPPFNPAAKVEALLELIDPSEILKVAFVRQKINLTVKDVSTLDFEAIKATGITALNVVGPTLKFHYAAHTVTEAVYKALEQTIER